MNDLYSQTLTKLTKKLQEKELEIKRNNQNIKKTQHKSNTLRQELSTLQNQKHSLEKQAKEFKSYASNKFWTIVEYIGIIILALMATGIFNLIFYDTSIMALINAEKGLDVPMHTPIGNLIFKGMWASLNIAIIYFTGKEFKNINQNSKELQKRHQKYSSLEEITKLIQEKDLEIKNLSEIIKKVEQDYNNLQIQSNILDLERQTLNKKITTVKEAIITALQKIDSPVIEPTLNQNYNNSTLSCDIAKLDAEEQNAKEDIIKRTRSY